MIQYHGWIVIREHYCEDEESEDVFKEIVDEVNLRLCEFEKYFSDVKINLNILNGIYQIFIFGSSNHSTTTWEEICNFLRWLTKYAVGSYGLIYFHNDEDINNSNNFVIYILKKGQLFIENDFHLSPIIPTIE